MKNLIKTININATDTANNALNAKHECLAYRNTHTKSKMTSLISITVAVFLFTIVNFWLLPSSAYAMTLAEYDTAIAEAQATVDQKNIELANAQSDLDETTKWIYKNTGGGAGAIIQFMASGQDLTETVENIEYMQRIIVSYQEQAAAAATAAQEAQKAVDELEELREEQAARLKALSTKNEIHFQQGGGNAWSGLSYWNGTVASSGCGLCAYTVIIDVLTGYEYTPTDMLKIRGDWRGMDGYPNDSTGSGSQTHAEFTKSTFDIDMYEISIDVDSMKAALEGGESAVMVCARGSVFKDKQGNWRYSSGHFIAVYGYDEEGFHVADSAYNSSRGANVIYSDSDMARLLSGSNHVVVYEN